MLIAYIIIGVVFFCVAAVADDRHNYSGHLTNITAYAIVGVLWPLFAISVCVQVMYILGDYLRN